MKQNWRENLTMQKYIYSQVSKKVFNLQCLCGIVYKWFPMPTNKSPFSLQNPRLYGTVFSFSNLLKKCIKYLFRFVCFIAFNATFNNISVISWRSVLVVEETGVPAENHRPVASHWQTLSHNVVLSTPRHEQVLNLQL